VDFLQSCVPIRFRTDKQLISHDTHNNTYNYKYTFSVEIVAVCKVCVAEGGAADGNQTSQNTCDTSDLSDHVFHIRPLGPRVSHQIQLPRGFDGTAWILPS
jgi:NMD protein affecting ribosome stability and mRNA decay